MPSEIICLSCHRLLHIAEANTRPTLTCPHCLALVINPRALVRTEIQTSPRTAEPGEEQPTCPACGAHVETRWRRCPHCEESLHRGPIAANDDSLDDEAQQGNRTASVIAAVLGGLLVTGIIIFFQSGGGSLVSASAEGPAVFGIGILVLGAIVAGMIAIVASSKNHAVTAVTSVFGGLLIGAGVVVLLVVLVCLGIMQTCANIGKH